MSQDFLPHLTTQCLEIEKALISAYLTQENEAKFDSFLTSPPISDFSKLPNRRKEAQGPVSPLGKEKSSMVLISTGTQCLKGEEMTCTQT